MTGVFYRRIATASTIGRLAPAYAALGVLKHVMPLRRLAPRAWKQQQGPRDPEAERRVIGAVARLRSWFGADEDCLQASLLLYRELSGLGADPTLVLGFRRLNDHIQGHAWVLVDGRIIPDEPDVLFFEPTLHFGRRGAVVSERASHAR